MNFLLEMSKIIQKDVNKVSSLIIYLFQQQLSQILKEVLPFVMFKK
jgi:hypothetical protein